MPTLYVVATPIGNLEDITLRAVRTLREVKLIAAEDTRKTRKLLTHYEIKTPLTSYYEQSRRLKLDYILNYLKDGDVALVSEAGMPGLSDPGYNLIAAAYERDIPVVPIPGPSAVVTALVVSGLPADRFTYIGFLPSKAKTRQDLLKTLAEEVGTIVAFEAPHRLEESLKDIRDALGDRRIAVCRELTKVHEEVFRGSVSEAIEHFTQPRGEFTLVIQGRTKSKPQLTEDTEKQLHCKYLSGMPAKRAIAEIAQESGLSRKELYRTWLKMIKETTADKTRSTRRS